MGKMVGLMPDTADPPLLHPPFSRRTGYTEAILQGSSLISRRIYRRTRGETVLSDH